MVPQNWPCFRKIGFCHFQIDIIQTSLLQNVSEKRDCFFAKLWTKKDLWHQFSLIMCWQLSVNNAENSMWHNRAPMFWHAIDCVAVHAYFECAYKVASIISVKEREREREREKEKRSSVEELLGLPDSSLVSVISFHCQLAFRNANSEKQSIYSNSITFLQS